MQIDYTLTRDDYVRHIKYLQWRIKRSVSPRFWIQIPAIVILVTLVLLIERFASDGLGMGIPTSNRITIAVFLIFVLITVSLWAYIFLLTRKSYQAMISEDSPLLGDSKLEVHETGLTHKCQHSESTLDWEMIRAVDDDSHNVYLLYDNGVGGVAIPKRAFASQDAIESFMAMVGAKVLAQDGSKDREA